MHLLATGALSVPAPQFGSSLCPTAPALRRAVAMPSTAGDLVPAARIVFGRPKDERAEELMTRWLDHGCRDWRRETAEQDNVVVSAVFVEPVKAQNLRMQVAQNVKRWGFLRRGHVKEQLVFLTVDEYLNDGVGDLVRGRVRQLLTNGVKKFQEAKEKRAKVLQDKLAAFRAKQRQRHLPVLKLCLKSLWDVASNGVRKKLGDKPFREDRVARRRRMTRGVDYDRLDEYTEEGEPDFAVQDRKRRARLTVQVQV